MDGVPGLTQHHDGVNKAPERRSSGDAPKQDKKKGRSRRRDHQPRAQKSGNENNYTTAKDKSFYPYPCELAEDDLYDHPPASSNGSRPQRDGYEEDWDLCE